MARAIADLKVSKAVKQPRGGLVATASTPGVQMVGLSSVREQLEREKAREEELVRTSPVQHDT